MDLEIAREWVQFFSDVGIIAWLAGSVYLFVKGYVFSRDGVKAIVVETVEEVLPQSIEEAIKRLTPEIVEAVYKGVRDSAKAENERRSL